MSLVGRTLVLGWMTTILVVHMSVAKHSRWALRTKPQMLWDLSGEELEAVHNFVMSSKELELQPSTLLTLAKNSVFLIEMLMPKKYEVLAFLDKGAMLPLREARVLIYFGAQEYPNVTEYAVGPVEQPMYMRKLNRKGGQQLSWASRPMSKVESALLLHTLKTATKPLQEFFFDTTGFTLQDCNGGCLTFTNVGPRAMTFGKRHSWFLLQRIMNDYFLQPTGLEILLDHGSTDVQDWIVEQVWYNGKFYNSPEELAQKYADGEVDIVVLEDPLPKTTEQFPQFSTYKPYAEFLMPISKGGPRVIQLYPEFPMPISKGGPQKAQPDPKFPIPISKGGPQVAQPYREFPMPISKGGPQVVQPDPKFPIPISKGGPRVPQPHAKFPMPISKGGPRVVQPKAKFPMPISKGGPQIAQPHVPHYRLKHNTVLYGDWNFFFKLHSSYGLQLFNVHFRGERIAYEVGVQEVMALYRGHTAAGRKTKYMDVGWGLGGITHQLTPGIDCPHEATFLDAIHYYDSDGPVLSRRALCIFEMPLRQYFNSNFRSSFSSYAKLSGPMLVLRTASTIHNHDYIWDFIFHSNGMMEGKMYATGYVHATFYSSEGLLYHSRLHTHLLGNVHSHLAHYRIDLDVAGTKNRFQTLKMRLENIMDPWSQQVKPILDKTQYSWERQAAFHFRQTLPKYLLFSNTGKSVSGLSHSYRLHVPSMAEQVLPPGWQTSPAFTWPRYQLAVTKYQESERFHGSLYNQNHHWAYPMVFENFIHNNENIEDEDLVAWVTVGLSHNHHSEIVPSVATPGNSAGFLLQPFDFYNSFRRYTGHEHFEALQDQALGCCDLQCFWLRSAPHRDNTETKVRNMGKMDPESLEPCDPLINYRGSARLVEEQDKERETFPEHMMSVEPNNHDDPQDCNGCCLTFAYVAPQAEESSRHLIWFIWQCFAKGHFLSPTGLEVLVVHSSTDVQDWRVEQLWYNSKFYNSPEELAQKYADGEVDMVVPRTPCPRAQSSHHSPLPTRHAEFFMSIRRLALK